MSLVRRERNNENSAVGRSLPACLLPTAFCFLKRSTLLRCEKELLFGSSVSGYFITGY